MKKLILVRHGQYNYRTGSLTENGRIAIRQVGKQLRSRVTGAVGLFSSTQLRATESTDILADIFELSYETDDVLWSAPDHMDDLPACLAYIKKQEQGIDTMILVTHFEYCLRLPNYFAQEVLYTEFDDVFPIRRGDAWVIDCDKKSLQYVSGGV